MSLLEIILLSLLGAGLITYIIIVVVKTVRKKKNPKEDDEEWLNIKI